MTFIFGDTLLEPERFELIRNGTRIALEPQAFDVLVYLVQHRDRVVAKEELMDQIWGGRFITEAAVTSRIKQARRAIGDDGQSQTRIRTYHGRGYRFVAEVIVAAPGSDGRVDDRETQPTEDAPVVPTRGRGSSDAVDHLTAGPADLPVLAYPRGGAARRFQLSGQGPPDLLLLPPPAALTHEWADAGRAQLLHGLGAMARVIRFESDDPSLDSGDDPEVLAVLDAAASDRPVVLAEGTGAVRAVQLAVRHPERVAGLVLFGGSFPAGSASTGGLDDLPLGSVGAPTLVVHRTADPVVPIARGRALAAAIPEAEFRAVPGDAHEAHRDADQVLVVIGDFVREVADRQAADRSLNALVGLAGGDVTALASVLVQLGGTLRQGPEQAVIVSFDGPANALRALGSRRARGLRSEVGVGLAIDEIPRDSFLVSGHGVDVARLFAQHAGRGEVLLPNVIKHLLAGSGLTVETLTPLDLPHVGPHPVHRWLPG